ncbi:hypothetical protein CFSAN002368_11271 [Clostridium botulinum A1 str. CFSAN002368]|nr:hypothetical protein CFSAN002368_11271 [Clostridium botulinum A1 str. CFSAN002368]
METWSDLNPVAKLITSTPRYSANSAVLISNSIRFFLPIESLQIIDGSNLSLLKISSQPVAISDKTKPELFNVDFIFLFLLY